MDASAGELPNQPGVNGSERELASTCEVSRTWNVVQQPARLCSGEVRVEDEAGTLLKERCHTVFAQTIAIRGGSAALPNDRVMNRFSGLTIPNNSCFPLIGDSDCGDLIGLYVRLSENNVRGVDLGGPDVFRAMFDPAGLRKE